MEQLQEILRQISSGEPLGPAAFVVVMFVSLIGLWLVGKVAEGMAWLYVMLRHGRDQEARRRALEGDE